MYFLSHAIYINVLPTSLNSMSSAHFTVLGTLAVAIVGAVAYYLSNQKKSSFVDDKYSYEDEYEKPYEDEKEIDSRVIMVGGRHKSNRKKAKTNSRNKRNKKTEKKMKKQK